jgi:fatty acid desaturase
MNVAIDPRSGEHAEPKMGSERRFGLVFGGVLAIIGLWPLLRASEVRLWFLVIAAAFFAAASFAPRTLAPLNRLWFRIGILLGKVMTPLIMAVLFFVVVTPVGFLIHFFGKDSLRLKHDPTAKSYWIERSPPGPAAGSFNDQF